MFNSNTAPSTGGVGVSQLLQPVGCGLSCWPLYRACRGRQTPAGVVALIYCCCVLLTSAFSCTHSLEAPRLLLCSGETRAGYHLNNSSVCTYIIMWVMVGYTGDVHLSWWVHWSNSWWGTLVLVGYSGFGWLHWLWASVELLRWACSMQYLNMSTHEQFHSYQCCLFELKAFCL